MERGTVCMLPGGYLDERGTLHLEAELTPLTGQQEELLVGGSAPVPALVTQVLTQCVRRIGSVAPVTAAVARCLVVADRQYLLLKLREITFGGRVQGTLACPWPECGAKVEVDFAIADIPVKRCEQLDRVYSVELSDEALFAAADGAVPPTITFRLPTGDDQERLGPTLVESAAQALTQLLERCIQPAPFSDVTTLVTSLSPRARWEIERAMEARAPHVELDMDLTCPDCGRGFTAPFDVLGFFFGELRTSQDLLYREVHYLAYHYHWSEREILDLPREKRLAYIGILADEIEALNDAR